MCASKVPKKGVKIAASTDTLQQQEQLPKSSKLGAKSNKFGESTSETENMTDVSEDNEINSHEPGQRRSAQDRAGVKFPINKLAKFARQGKYAERVGQGAPVYMAGVLEYLALEILELASNKAGEDKKKTIMPRHIMLAIRSDDEFNRFMKGADFKETGRVPITFGDNSNNKKKKGQLEESDSDDELMSMD